MPAFVRGDVPYTNAGGLIFEAVTIYRLIDDSGQKLTRPRFLLFSPLFFFSISIATGVREKKRGSNKLYIYLIALSVGYACKHEAGLFIVDAIVASMSMTACERTLLGIDCRYRL